MLSAKIDATSYPVVHVKSPNRITIPSHAMRVLEFEPNRPNDQFLIYFKEDEKEDKNIYYNYNPTFILDDLTYIGERMREKILSKYLKTNIKEDEKEDEKFLNTFTRCRDVDLLEPGFGVETRRIEGRWRSGRNFQEVDRKLDTIKSKD